MKTGLFSFVRLQVFGRFPDDLKKHILGAECCCWSEGTRTGPILHQKTWPRAAIFAETVGGKTPADMAR